MFLNVHRQGQPFEEDCSAAIECIAIRHLLQQAPQSRSLAGFEQYLARKKAAQQNWARRNL
jgi:hypothetical protein